MTSTESIRWRPSICQQLQGPSTPFAHGSDLPAEAVKAAKEQVATCHKAWPSDLGPMATLVGNGFSKKWQDGPPTEVWIQDLFG